MKDSATIINGKRYIPTKLVYLDEHHAVYQEYISADIMNPEVIYVAHDSKNKGSVLDEQSPLYTALREKYTDRETLYGDFSVQSWQLGKLNRRNFVKDFSIVGVGLVLGGLQACKKEEEKFIEHPLLKELFEEHLKLFPANAAKNSDLQGIISNRGLGGVEHYYQGRLRGRAGYYYNPAQKSAGTYNVESDRIVYRNVTEAEKDQRICAHEMTHKSSAEKINSSHYRVGFLTGKKSKRKWTYLGKGFNEGATEANSTVYLNHQFDNYFIKDSPYRDETEFYKGVQDKLGSNKIILESFNFDPRIFRK